MKQGLIIGESFNPIDYGDNDSWDNAFSKLKASGKTILGWLGLSYEETWKMFDSLNIKNRSNDIIPRDALLERIADHEITLVFGRIAERHVFGEIKPELPYHSYVNGHLVSVFPHPSGRNRKLNDKDLLEKCKSICQLSVGMLYVCFPMNYKDV